MRHTHPIHYFGNIIAIVVVAGLVWGAIQFKENPSYYNARSKLQSITSEIKNFINVRKHNISMEMNPPRKAPLSFLEREGKLELWAEEIFGPFSEEDWHFFWSLIYEQISVKEGKYTVKRYRTRQEVESILRDEFSALSYLKDPEWSELWGVAGVGW